MPNAPTEANPSTQVRLARRDVARDARAVADIETVVRSGDIPKAVEMARAALDAGNIHPMLFNLRSNWHVRQGRTQDALTDLRTALALAPRDRFVRNALGVLLERLGRWSEARPILEESVRLAPDFPPARYALGWLYAFTGELDAAQQCFEAAIAFDPQFADALAQLASLAGRRADWKATEEWANRALAVQHDHPVALTALAGAMLAQNLPEACEALLDRIGDFARLSLLERSLAQTMRGDLRDAQGRHAAAFVLYAERNRQKFLAAAPQFDVPGTTVTDYVRWLKDYFAALPPNAWASPKDSHENRDGATGHVFLVGFPRSGTTLLENILASHPGVAALDERDTLGEAAQEFLVGDEGRERLAKLSAAEIEKHRAIYWRRVREFGADVTGKVFLDKYPLSSIKLPLVAKLFPEARILFAIRDPRDVLLSCFRRSFTLNSSMFELLDLERGARFYAAVMDLAAVYRDKLDLAWHPLRYESLVADFEGEMRGVCDFIGLAWDDQLRDFAKLAKARTIKTPSSTQVVRGLYREGAGQWRNYESELAPALPILAPWIQRYGYD